MSKKKTPNPGSDEAINRGCLCPILENRRGEGIYPTSTDEAWFWVNDECPLHGFKQTFSYRRKKLKIK